MVLTVSGSKQFILAEISYFAVEKVLSGLLEVTEIQRYFLAKVERKNICDYEISTT
jgi:hypothetical protein